MQLYYNMIFGLCLVLFHLFFPFCLNALIPEALLSFLVHSLEFHFHFIPKALLSLDPLEFHFHLIPKALLSFLADPLEFYFHFYSVAEVIYYNMF